MCISWRPSHIGYFTVQFILGTERLPFVLEKQGLKKSFGLRLKQPDFQSVLDGLCTVTCLTASDLPEITVAGQFGVKPLGHFNNSLGPLGRLLLLVFSQGTLYLKIS